MNKENMSELDFHGILDQSKNKFEFQKLYEIILHAKTCKKCSKFYIKALNVSNMHIQNTKI